jgi:hypothetical protein
MLAGMHGPAWRRDSGFFPRPSDLFDLPVIDSLDIVEVLAE